MYSFGWIVMTQPLHPQQPARSKGLSPNLQSRIWPHKHCEV